MSHTHLHSPRSSLRLDEQFGIIANATPVMVWISDPNKTCYFFNKGWLQFTGKMLDQEYGLGWLQGVHPDDREQCLAVFEQASDQQTEFKRQYRLRRHDGIYRWILDHGAPQYTLQGEFAGYLGSCIDMEDGDSKMHEVTKNAPEKEASLDQAVQELQRSNEALEQFAFIASHDMKEPLRKILVYNEFMMAQGDDTEKYAAKIRDAALRMNTLIDDLLNLSRIHSKNSSFEWTDLNNVVADVKTDLELFIAEKQATIRSESLPVIYCIQQQMRQVIYNLVANALKYSKSETPPVVTITCFDSSAEKFPNSGLVPGLRYVEIVVTDNGMGFDQENAEKIFTLFHRLHSQSEIAGTGMGLALCKKVLENHQGIIFAISKVNEGSSFHIVVPEDPRTLHLIQ